VVVFVAGLLGAEDVLATVRICGVDVAVLVAGRLETALAPVSHKMAMTTKNPMNHLISSIL
jgi:hypothetical protein